MSTEHGPYHDEKVKDGLWLEAGRGSAGARLMVYRGPAGDHEASEFIGKLLLTDSQAYDIGFYLSASSVAG